MEISQSFRAMLDEAQAALSGGDAADAERRAKAVSALVRAERDTAEFLNETRAAALEDDDDACRAELQRRLSLYSVAASSGAPDQVLAHIARTGAAP